MTDPRDDSSSLRLTGAFELRLGSSIWGWLAIVAAAVFIIAIVYGFANQGTQMAFDRNAPTPIENSLTRGVSTTGAGGTPSFGAADAR